MSQSATTLRIGSRVKVDLEKVKDRIPSSLANLLKNDPRGTIKDYKMTDGMGVGLILELGDGTSSWFFDEEISRA